MANNESSPVLYRVYNEAPPGIPDGRIANLRSLHTPWTLKSYASLNEWEDRAAYSIACHSAIRAGKVMSNQEMSELTRQLEECQQPNNCPHGRPTMIHLSESQLEREFGRR